MRVLREEAVLRWGTQARGLHGSLTEDGRDMDDSPGGTTSCMRRSASAALALGLALGSVALPPIASAAPAPNWDGWYKITFQTDQKSSYNFV